MVRKYKKDKLIQKSINLEEKDWAFIEKLAEEAKISCSAVVREMVFNTAFLERVLKENEKLASLYNKCFERTNIIELLTEDDAKKKGYEIDPYSKNISELVRQAVSFPPKEEKNVE